MSPAISHCESFVRSPALDSALPIMIHYALRGLRFRSETYRDDWATVTYVAVTLFFGYIGSRSVVLQCLVKLAAT